MLLGVVDRPSVSSKCVIVFVECKLDGLLAKTDAWDVTSKGLDAIIATPEKSLINWSTDLEEPPCSARLCFRDAVDWNELPCSG